MKKKVLRENYSVKHWCQTADFGHNLNDNPNALKLFCIILPNKYKNVMQEAIPGSTGMTWKRGQIWTHAMEK